MPSYIAPTLPENMYLGLTPDDTPAIFDAQDIMWVEFTDGGVGDPVDWQTTIIRQTCAVLGVTVAINEAGDLTSVAKFIEDYNGSVV